MRDEFLASKSLENLPAARKRSAACKDDYNHHRPHGSRWGL
ncbi:MAG: transposase [Planctomycetia bacterium]|nr:transposase [Planctomycetia bacterium]